MRDFPHDCRMVDTYDNIYSRSSRVISFSFYLKYDSEWVYGPVITITRDVWGRGCKISKKASLFINCYFGLELLVAFEQPIFCSVKLL